jgi:hypothetical protein
MNKELIENENMISTISTDAYNTICNTVFDYMTSFNNPDQAVQYNFMLKREHINRVVGYSEVLTRDLELSDEMTKAAQLTAMLHDIGRFEQFGQFKTYNDSISFDHAQKAVDLIEENSWLAYLTDDVQQIIKKAILYHNKISIPKGESEPVLLLSKIIRDADKTDILDIAIREYSLPIKSQNNFFSLELENKPTFSKKVTNAIIAGKIADKKDLKTVNDFKLMLMSYVFDINFKKTFITINKKQYLKQLFDTLPKSDEIFEVYRSTKIHVENQLS